MEQRIEVVARTDFPVGLDELKDGPEWLWRRGTLPRRPLVGIVGTRRADRAGLEYARRLASELAELGVGIVSGGAEGVDAAAHRGALDGGAPTWVVQAAPLDRPYPRRHRRLFAEILERGGGWLSETPLGARTYPSRFLARNRIVAAIADAIVVVQAPLPSGALSTARHARVLGRPLFAVPHAPWDPRGEGCLRLLREGAHLCTSTQDVARALGLRAPIPAEVGARRPHADLPPDLTQVLEVLGPTPRHADEVAQDAGLSAPRVQVALVQLAARGLAFPTDGGWKST